MRLSRSRNNRRNDRSSRRYPRAWYSRHNALNLFAWYESHDTVTQKALGERPTSQNVRSLVGLRSLKVFGGQTIGSMLKTTGTFNEENKERKERGIVASVGREETLGNQTTRDSRASERGAWRLCLPATLVCPSLPG